jgi:hypothetical protein
MQPVHCYIAKCDSCMPAQQAVTSFWAHSLFAVHVLHNGSQHRQALRQLARCHWPKYNARVDCHKLPAASAQAGWMVVSMKGEHVVDRLLDKLQTRMGNYLE